MVAEYEAVMKEEKEKERNVKMETCIETKWVERSQMFSGGVRTMDGIQKSDKDSITIAHKI